MLCKSCRFKGVNILNKKKKTKKGVKPKTSVQVRRGGNCYRFGTLQAKIVKASACNVSWKGRWRVETKLQPQKKVAATSDRTQ